MLAYWGPNASLKTPAPGGCLHPLTLQFVDECFTPRRPLAAVLSTEYRVLRPHDTLIDECFPPYPCPSGSGTFPPPVSGCAIGPTVHGWFLVLGVMMVVGGCPLFHLPWWGRWLL